VTFAAITLCVDSQRVFIVVYYVIDSVRKILDTPSLIKFAVGCILLHPTIAVKSMVSKLSCRLQCNTAPVTKRYNMAVRTHF
jgi:hypothetical protein